MKSNLKTKIPVLIDSYNENVIWIFCPRCSGYIRVDLNDNILNCDCCKSLKEVENGWLRIFRTGKR